MDKSNKDMTSKMEAARREMRRTLLRLDVPADVRKDLMDKYYRAITLTEHETARIARLK